MDYISQTKAQIILTPLKLGSLLNYTIINNSPDNKYLFYKPDIDKVINLNLKGTFKISKICANQNAYLSNTNIWKNKQNNHILIYQNHNALPICSRCLQLFHSNAKRKRYLCPTCESNRNLDRYYNLDINEKQKFIEQIKTYKSRANYQDKTNSLRKTDTIYRITHNLSGRIRKRYKIERITRGYLGCSRKELKIYLESLFQPGMTWENYGPGYERDANGKPIKNQFGKAIYKQEWQIDHIKPLAKFDLTDINQLKLAMHYTNLQPLWAKDNVEKHMNSASTTNQNKIEIIDIDYMI